MKWIAKLLLFLGLLYPPETALVTKSITRYERTGHWTGRTLDCVRPIWGLPWLFNGLVNSIGLTNRGFDWWIANVAPELQRKREQRVISLFGTPTELREMAKILNDDWPDIIIAIEINVSCPNVKDMCALENTGAIIRSVIEVSEVTGLPIILKLNVTQDAKRIITAIRGKIVAVSINSVPYPKRFQNKKSPLVRPGFEHFGPGGVSGFSAQELVKEFVETLVSLNVSVIGSSVWFDPRYIIWLWNAGVSAIGYGAIYLVAPWLVVIFVRWDSWRRRRLKNKRQRL